MITLLARIFIREDDKPEKVRLAYGILCGIVGILLNVLLFTGKFIPVISHYKIAVLRHFKGIRSCSYRPCLFEIILL